MIRYHKTRTYPPTMGCSIPGFCIIHTFSFRFWTFQRGLLKDSRPEPREQSTAKTSCIKQKQTRRTFSRWRCIFKCPSRKAESGSQKQRRSFDSFFSWMDCWPACLIRWWCWWAQLERKTPTADFRIWRSGPKKPAWLTS